MSKPKVAPRSCSVEYIDDGPCGYKRILVNVELVVLDEEEVGAVQIADIKNQLANTAGQIVADNISTEKGGAR